LPASELNRGRCLIVFLFLSNPLHAIILLFNYLYLGEKKKTTKMAFVFILLEIKKQPLEVTFTSYIPPLFNKHMTQKRLCIALYMLRGSNRVNTSN
jgi:hypothetical protein